MNDSLPLVDCSCKILTSGVKPRRAPLQSPPTLSMDSKGTPCLRWQLEHTDTFGGEANYSWVNREDVMIPSKYSGPWIVRKAKEAMGLTQLDHVTSDLGDTIRVDFRQDNQVLFITLLS